MKLPLGEATGLRPKTWICVGQGYSREDVKAALLRESRGFVADAVTGLQDLCAKIAGVDPARILGASSSASLSRQEILRHLLAQRAIAGYFPELKELRRQRSFFRNLDRSLQSARLSFAHPEEAVVLADYLETRIGKSALRRELQAFNAAYESWMEGTGWWDLPMLVRAATECLERGWPENVLKPETICKLSGVAEESLERQFWEAMSRHVEVRQAEEDAAGSCETWTWNRWHTPDDAADGLADALAELAPEQWDENAILFPDTPDIRRSLLRAFAARGLPLADPRDPARLRKEEVVKQALLPLRLLSKGFRRADVLAYLTKLGTGAEVNQWSLEVSARGARKGLFSYGGEKLAPLREKLRELQTRLGGRAACEEIANRHLQLLRESADPENVWVVPFFEAQWRSLAEDLARVGFSRAAPLAFWTEKLSTRVFEGTPPAERLRPEHGIRLFRLQQFPLERRGSQKLWLFGVPTQWLSEAAYADYWFSQRDRELLSLEFPVRSGAQLRAERLNALKAWLRVSSSVSICDFSYAFDGRERESIKSALAELGAPEELLAKGPAEQGCHPRWLPSYGVKRPEPPREALLDPIAVGASGVPELSATTLDRMSRCAFQALALQRWKLWDDKDPDTELWPEAKGNLLHQAVKFLLRSRDEEGRFMLSCAEALDSAWKERPPKGLFRSPRVEAYVRSRLVSVLETFCEQEREFIQRARTRTISLEDRKFRLDYPEFAIVGEPDRIEEHPDGLFVSDYKTSSALPNGQQMVELGYRLQLPFYALASARHYGKPVIGIQFIQLTREGGRNSGVLFSAWNGKEPGKLTKARSNSKSLFNADPAEIWSRLEEHIVREARAYVSGQFKAAPKRGADECKTCQAADLCGFRRRGESGEDDG